MILEAMYNGEFYPCETVVPTSPEYRKAVIACEKLMEQLSQRLSKEDYELVQELRAQTAIAQDGCVRCSIRHRVQPGSGRSGQPVVHPQAL